MISLVGRAVRFVEVGPRDGLQNERIALSPAARVALVRDLVAAGLRAIEVGAFVSEQRVPQMAGSGEVLRALPRKDGVAYAVLVPNLKGMDAALAAGASEVSVFVAASESFSQRNTQCSIAQGLERAHRVAALAHKKGVRVRGYVSCVVDCPDEGPRDPALPAQLARELIAMGCYEVSLGETIGTATVPRIRRMLDAVCRLTPMEQLAAHFHNTYGQALANVNDALEPGVLVVESAVAGLGGCPFVNGAAGNVATEDVLWLLDGLGMPHGVDLPAVARAGWVVCEALDRQPSSQVSLTLAAGCRSKT